jgi:hypothetical protein
MGRVVRLAQTRAIIIIPKRPDGCVAGSSGLEMTFSEPRRRRRPDSVLRNNIPMGWHNDVVSGCRAQWSVLGRIRVTRVTAILAVVECAAAAAAPRVDFESINSQSAARGTFSERRRRPIQIQIRSGASRRLSRSGQLSSAPFRQWRDRASTMGAPR